MNISIKTDEHGNITNYGLYFHINEYAAALESIKNLKRPPEQNGDVIPRSELCPDFGKGTISESKSVLMPKNSKHAADALNTEDDEGASLDTHKGRWKAYSISDEAIKILRLYLQPNINAAFTAAGLSLSGWVNIRRYKRISQKIWDKIASSFSIDYSIENDNIHIAPPPVEIKKETRQSPENNHNIAGVFVRYKLGADIQKRWIAACSQKDAVKKIKSIHKRRCDAATYNVAFKILDVKNMTYGEYKSLND